MKQRFSKRTRLVSALLTLAMVFTFLPFSAFAATGDVYIDTNFSDKNFQKYLKDNITGGKNYLTQKQCESVKEISLNKLYYPVEQLNGIQQFPNLEKLEADNLRSVDLSYNTALKELIVTGSHNLTSLDLSHNPNLQRLNCVSTGLTSLDLSHNPNLQRLNCDFTGLTSLDLSHNPELEYLSCMSTRLTKLDLSNNTKLTEVDCSRGKLTELNIKQCNFLKKLDCSQNNLTELDVPDTSRLMELNCSDNPLNTLHVEGKFLTKLNVKRTNLTALKLDLYPWLESIEIFGNNQLTRLEVSRMPKLKKLNCGKNQLTQLALSDLPELRELYCNGNQLTQLDIKELSTLKQLFCNNNQLTSLDVSENPALWNLECSENQLTSLDVSKNPALMNLYCKKNQLTSLDVSQNTNLSILSCRDNKIDINIEETSRTFDLSTLPGFDVSKATNWKGGTVNGSILTVDNGATEVTYSYDCGPGATREFSLQVLTMIEQVNIRVNTPKKHEMPDETVVILDNGADVCDVKIRWGKGDIGGEPIPGTFRPGTRYTLQVGLYAKPGYKFSEETVCTVNGREAKFLMTLNDDTEYYAIKHYSVPLSPGGFEHDHKMEMTHDEHSHWKECPICHTVQDTEAHVYDDDKDTTCNVCGYVRSLTPGGTPGGSTPGGDNPGGGSTPGGTTPGGSTGGGDGGGAVVIVAAVGAVAAGVVGYGVYNYVSGQKLQALLPEGVAAPENRAQTALLLWNTAGRPEPAEAPAFADVADPDTAKAAQWCVEQGLMKRRLNGKFAPGSSIPAYQVLNAYRKLAG